MRSYVFQDRLSTQLYRLLLLSDSSFITEVMNIFMIYLSDLINALNSDRIENMATTATSLMAKSLSSSGTVKKKKPEEIKAIRLANNSICDLQILVNPFSSVFDTSKITWLDVSFNQIEKIHLSVFDAFPNITALYLQANAILRLSEIRKLQKFTFLKSLAIFGNPVEEHKHYRNYVLFFCKSLTNFDMSPVTKSERKMVRNSRHNIAFFNLAVCFFLCLILHSIFFLILFQNDIWSQTYRKKLLTDMED